MKILIINPDYGMTQEEMALRCRILEEYTAPDTQLAMVCPQSSGVELNSALDVVLAAPEIVQLAADGQNAGFDAVVFVLLQRPCYRRLPRSIAHSRYRRGAGLLPGSA